MHSFIQQSHLLFFKWAHTRTGTHASSQMNHSRWPDTLAKSTMILHACCKILYTHMKYCKWPVVVVVDDADDDTMNCSAIQHHCAMIFIHCFHYYFAPYLTLGNDLKWNAYVEICFFYHTLRTYPSMKEHNRLKFHFRIIGRISLRSNNNNNNDEWMVLATKFIPI